VCVSSVFLFFVPPCFFVPLPHVAFLWLFIKPENAMRSPGKWKYSQDSYNGNGDASWGGGGFSTSWSGPLKKTNGVLWNGAVFLTKMAICNCAPKSNTIGPLHFGSMYKMVIAL
jgi:hypothetical protein